MNKEIDNTEIWHSEYEIRQFIDMAIRWKIDGVYDSRTENRPFSIFTFYVENARDNFDKFCIQLRNKLSITNNWKAIEIDIKNRFLPMINQYKEWYQLNSESLTKFEPYNPYALMLNVIESTKSEIIKYFHISDIEKKECDRFIFPFGLPYNLGNEFENRIKELDGKFENTDKYLERLKSVFHSNGLRFFNKIKDLDRIDFIDALEVQYNYKNETEQNMYGWLNLTYDLIIKGFSIAGTVDIEKQSDFKKWFNEKIETKKYYEYEIVSHIIGQRNNMNSPKTLQPCYHYIKDVFSKYQLNSIKAKEMVNDFKGSFSPDWNKNVIPFIIDYLGSINVTSETQQRNKETRRIVESKEPTLKQIALYHYYLGNNVNKDNEAERLKGTNHKINGKLKQHYDYYYQTLNRTNGGTDRENGAHKRLMKAVILMLKETSNYDAILKAEKELVQFEKIIA